MKELFEVLEERIQKGKDSMLVTIVEGSGSIPRSAGAYMVVGEEGRVYGTIGGGNLEYQAILTGQELVKKQENFLRTYNLGPKQAAELGMVCGGRAKVLFYYMGASQQETRELIKQGVAVSAAHRAYWLLLPLQNGKADIEEFPESFAESVENRKIGNQKAGHQRQMIVERDGNEYYAEQFSYDGRVYIFGGGHVAQETVPVLSRLGFCCVVVDDREEFANPQLFPGAEETVKAEFTNLQSRFQITADDYVVIMTRGHLCDTDVERFALTTDAGYIGVMGSRKKAKFVRDKLEEEGYTKEQLDRVITPIGLDIGAETPAEIAISIAAQLIQFRVEKR